jgi:hypothetical protein
MTEKYLGLIPKGSIWFRLTGDEARILVHQNPEFMAQLPADKPLEELDSIEIQAFPGKCKDIEDLLTKAGLTIVTLFD